LAVAVAVPLGVHAHGTGNKVIGTVTAVHASMNHVEVKTKDGHTVGIKVNDGTKFMMGSRAASFGDLKEGARVVITTTGEGDERTATMVRLSGAGIKSTSTTKTAGPPKH
jgi:hypothetical protein